MTPDRVQLYARSDANEDRRVKHQSPPQRHHLDKRAEAIAELLTAGDPERLMSTVETAELLDCSRSFLEIGRMAGRALAGRAYGPPAIHITPKMCRYRRRDVLKWIEERAALAATSVVVIVVFFAVSVLTALAG